MIKLVILVMLLVLMSASFLSFWWLLAIVPALYWRAMLVLVAGSMLLRRL